MVAPVTDLGTSTVTRNFIDEYGRTHARYYEFRHRYRQKKPFTLTLPYDAQRQFLQSYFLSSSSASFPLDADDPQRFTVDWTPVTNRAYAKLRSKLYETVGAGVDFAEYKQSAASIASTATALFKAARAVRRGRFGDAADALRMKYFPKGVSVHKSFANNWLEYHFGWEPLVKDIYDACDVINNPVKSFALERGRAKDVIYQHTSQDLGSVVRDDYSRGVQSCTQGARIHFANPGLAHTLHQWGLDDPVGIAWELVPFSFVVDWFVNVGEFLASRGDFAGMQLDYTYKTLKLDVTTYSILSTKSGFSPAWYANSTVRYVNVSRTTSLSGTALEVKKLKPPSLVRAATAISLLVQVGLRE